MNMKTKPIPERIVYIGKLMFNRHLTDIAGGNISVRDGDKIYCTPSLAGGLWHWGLDADDIVMVLIHNNDFSRTPTISREALSHIAVYKAFPGVKAIIHAHPPHILSFTAANKPIQPVLRNVEKYGTLEYIGVSPAYSQKQADDIIRKLRPKEELMNVKAAAVLMPRHGIFVAGADLWQAIDALERMETNAKCLIDQALIRQWME
jgi:L-fuculose-phosphate aldolase